MCISIPYWYQGSRADQAFSQLSEYIRVIRETAGFFAYDPQTGIAFDPQQTDLREHQHYEKVVLVLTAHAQFNRPRQTEHTRQGRRRYQESACPVHAPRLASMACDGQTEQVKAQSQRTEASNQ